MIEDEAVSGVDRTVERGKNARADHREARSHEPVGVPYSVVRTALPRRMGRTFTRGTVVQYRSPRSFVGCGMYMFIRVTSFNLVLSI